MNSFLDDLKNAFNKPNNGLNKLMAINIVVFVIMGIIYVVLKFSDNESIWVNYFYFNIAMPSDPASLLTKPWTLFTYMFAHSVQDIFHIIFNLLIFYWFGRLIMEFLGSDKLVGLYILGGIFGGLLYFSVYNLLPYFESYNATMIGASAAVYAIVVAAATLMPDYTFFLLFFGPVRIKYIAAITVFLSFLAMPGSNSGGNIAHIGGAILGFIYIKQLQKGIDIGKPVILVLNSIVNLFNKKPKIKVSYKRDFSQPKSKEKSSFVPPNQDEIDAILDKISQSGYEKLTKEEKQKLFKASQK